MTNSKPVIFLAFANNKEEASEYLRNLDSERKKIRDILQPAVAAGLCEIEIRSGISIDEIFDVFQSQKYRNRIAIFHFGGHADSYKLLLEAADQSKSPAFAEGLTAFLGQQRGLELVFLNGCSTQRQADLLTKEGVPAVIGTLREIDDRVAYNLAVRFYKGLSQGMPLTAAWKEAEANIKTEKGANFRGLYREEVRDVASVFPWKINYRSGATTVQQWNLPAAANQPLFGLPKLKSYDLPAEPYRFLGRYEEEDAAIFFGRGWEIRELYFRVTDQHSAPVILFSGQSGVGKSSLLAAGLIPRLNIEHQVQYQRTETGQPLLATLQQAVTEQAQKHALTLTSATDLAANWLQLEEASGQPLVIVIDQAETVFTRNNSTNNSELDEFLTQLQTIYQSSQQRPRGKLIFSYRKEYDADFRKAFKDAKIPFESMFLQQLAAEGISEIVQGLASREDLKRKYRLTVEPSLVNHIKLDLLRDKDSPIAPVLQIILTKLWQQQLSEQERVFRLADYQQLKDEGILLKDFYDQQMQKLVEWDRQQQQNLVASGLALDILDFHTSEWQVAAGRKLDNLRKQYEHRADILEAVLRLFGRHYLLAFVTKDKTTLAHDTLAPIVQQELKLSEKPGQKARRILETKTLNARHDADTIIEPEDLELVEAGQTGMRRWTIQEQELVDKSRIYRAEIEAERERNLAYRLKSERNRKRLRNWIMGLLALLLVGAGFFAYNRNQQAKISGLVAQSLAQEKIDPTKAFETIQTALAVDADDKIALQTRTDIYSDNEFYDGTWRSNYSVNNIRVTPSGDIFLATGNTVQLLNKEGKLIWEKVQDSQVFCVDAAQDGNQLLVGGEDGIIKIYNLNGEVIKWLKGHKNWVRAAIFSDDGNKVLSGDREGNIFLWADDTIQQKFTEHTDEIWNLSFLRNDSLFVSGSWDCSTKLWSVENGWIMDLPIAEQGLAISFSESAKIIAVGDRSGTIYYLDTDGTLITKVLAHKYRINDLKFSADGKMLLSASDDKLIKLWNTRGDLLKVYKGHADFVKTLDFGADDKLFYSGSQDKSWKKWWVESKVQQHFGKHGQEVADFALTQEEPLLVSVAGDGKQGQINQVSDCLFDFSAFLSNPLPQKGLIWNTKNNQLLGELTGHQSGIYAVDVNSTNNLIATGGGDATVIIWDTEGNVKKKLTTHTDRVNDVAFSPNGQYLATVSHDSMLIVVDVNNSFTELFREKHQHEINKVKFSPDGQYILTGTFDVVANLFDLEGQLIRPYDKSSAGITDLAISDNGQYALIADLDGRAFLYDVATADSLKVFTIAQKTKTGGQGINAVAFSPDTRYVALSGLAGITEIIDIETGELVQALSNLWLDGVFSVAFSRDGRWIYTGSQDGSIRKYKFYH